MAKNALFIQSIGLFVESIALCSWKKRTNERTTPLQYLKPWRARARRLFFKYFSAFWGKCKETVAFSYSTQNQSRFHCNLGTYPLQESVRLNLRFSSIPCANKAGIFRIRSTSPACPRPLGVTE